MLKPSPKGEGFRFAPPRKEAMRKEIRFMMIDRGVNHELCLVPKEGKCGYEIWIDGVQRYMGIRFSKNEAIAKVRYLQGENLRFAVDVGRRTGKLKQFERVGGQYNMWGAV